jgi:F-type H+-transporting ATPase subunit a
MIDPLTTNNSMKYTVIKLHNKFKAILGEKIKGRTFIFISLFSLILFNNFLGLLPFTFTRTRHFDSRREDKRL